MPELDAEKLKENALTSIRLGIEDFQRSKLAKDQGGDPARALSAVRNLFAGIVLLFKYKIAVSVDDPDEASVLIFNPPEVLPQADGMRWYRMEAGRQGQADNHRCGHHQEAV
jgi:hypothetical protein